jgi:hypothetical protein
MAICSPFRGGDPFMLVVAQRILIGGIVCLFPLFAYCLVLVALNSRRRASMIPGTWDFAGVLLANAGFLLAGGPLILVGLNAGWRRAVLHGQPGDWRSLSGEGDARALGMWAIYFLTIVVGAAWLIWSRRAVTVLYNVDTSHVWSALEWVMGRAGVVWERSENTYAIRKVVNAAAAPWLGETATKGGARTETASLAVRVLPSSCNVTLVWTPAESSLRELIEAEVSALLPNMRAAENPSLRWLVAGATALAGLISGAMVVFIVFAIRLRAGI